jgi:DNA-binding Lrp family transcriptional regulator
MGRHSYLIDVNFDNKEQLVSWIKEMKSAKLSSGVPAIVSVRTQKIIDILKKKKDFDLKDYLGMKEKHHFFLEIDCPSYDNELTGLLIKSPAVFSLLHIQGENSFIIEVIVEDYEDYKKLLGEIKKSKLIRHIETLEVLSVLKYRNMIIDDSGILKKPDVDIREIFTL